MGTKRPALWMVVDLEHGELPLYVATNSQDIADWAGTTRDAVLSSISHAKTDGRRCRFARVYIDEDDEVLQMEREGKLVGVKEIAGRIGIAASTFRRHKSEIPVIKQDNMLVADENELDAWLSKPPEWLRNCWKKKEVAKWKKNG